MVQIEKMLEEERRETIVELSTLLAVVQEMGQRLANETHGDSFYLVEELNEILHQARLAMKRIKSAQRKGD